MSMIEWTDETWNPVTGCTKVSAGCAHCYAERLAPRVFAGQRWPTGTGAGDSSPSPDTRPRRFTDVQCHPERLDKPLRWRRPRRVFVNSMSDLFHEDVPDGFIQKVFATCALAERHTFQVLTKRPERMRDFFADERNEEMASGWAFDAEWPPGLSSEMRVALGRDRFAHSWPTPNIWLGVSVEDQAAADERIPILLATPAVVRFVSCEPLLAAVDLRQSCWRDEYGTRCGVLFPLAGEGICEGMNEPRALNGGGIGWVIVGGESGPKARPCDVEWIRSIVSQCKAAGVPCFVKQLGGHPDKRADPAEWPEDIRVREWPR